MIIGVDPHKSSHTATAVDPATNTTVASVRVEATLAGYRKLLRWARQFGERRWAIENAKGLGCHLAQWLVARDEIVFDVATTATSRVRGLSRGGRRKNDVIDASAAASVAALQGDARAVVGEDATTVVALLEERRANLASQRVRLVNQLHALLRDLVPGGAPTDLSATAAAAILRSVRPATPVERTRKDLARDLVREIRGLDASLTDIAARMTAALDDYGSRLVDVDGIGPVLGVRLIGRTGRASRFPNPDAFASYAGAAPIEVSSGENRRHRLSRSGDRQLNSALHLVAVTQVRMTGSIGRRYFDRKLAEGKTRNEAMRCLKRRIAAHVWRLMLADEQRRQRDLHEGPAAA
jgi:transposase